MLEDGYFVGFNFRQLVKDSDVENRMSVLEMKNVWISFMNIVVKLFLGNSKDKNG